jgi:putative flippase GtrA
MVRRLARISSAYALVGLVSSAANLACQAAVIALYHGRWNIPISVLLGTAAGLPIKYVLEKRYVFAFTASDFRHDGRLFALYTFFGTFTTLVFWGTEYAFYLAFGSESMRFLGAALGLTAGYVLRYQVDKRFVFVASEAAARARSCAN